MAFTVSRTDNSKPKSGYGHPRFGSKIDVNYVKVLKPKVPEKPVFEVPAEVTEAEILLESASSDLPSVDEILAESGKKKGPGRKKK